jgi:hypothetical protein
MLPTGTPIPANVTLTPTVPPSRPTPIAAVGLPNTGGSTGVSSGVWLLLTGAVIFVIAILGVLAVSVRQLGLLTRGTSQSDEPWFDQDAAGERRGGRDHSGRSAVTGWIFVATATAAIMALIGYVLVSTDRDK